MTISIAVAWVQAHPAECWLALSATLNLLLRLRPPEAWVALCERSPVTAAVVGVVRSLGVDPVGALRTLASVVAVKAAQSTASHALEAPPPPTPRNTGLPPGGPS
jgi:hypothetical protein